MPVPSGTVTAIGTLDAGDCVRRFGGSPSLRAVDVYTVAGTAGSAINVEVTASGFTPWIHIIDSSGKFGEVDGSSPLEFYVFMTQPYVIMITSDPNGPPALGSYTLKLTQRTCPAPTVFTGNLNLAQTLSASDCPSPSYPPAKAKAYSFTSTAGERIKIAMSTPDFVVDPFLQLLGPSGRVLAEDDNGGNTGDLNGVTALNALIEFLSTQSGTYTFFASDSSGGALGKYTISFSRPVCSKRAVTVAASATKLSPQPLLTSLDCHNPLISPSADPFLGFSGPDRNTNADLYSVPLTAGAVFTATAAPVDTTAFDPHLWLLKPDNTIVAENDDEDQIGFTVPTTGTYTLVVGANTRDTTQSLDSSTPNPTAPYDLFLQGCPAAMITVNSTVSGNFTDADCEALGGVKTKSYTFTTAAPQFVTLTLTADVGDFTPRMNLIGADGRRVESTSESFLSEGARISRVLPSGTHYIEISGSAGDAPETLPAAFTLALQSCATQELTVGVTGGEFTDSDCQLADGSLFDVYTISGPVNSAASLRLPANGCSAVSLTEGFTVPPDYCLSGDQGDVPVPIAQAGTIAVMVVTNTPDQREPYELTYRSCPLTLIDISGTMGTIAGTDCADATGGKGDFYLFRAPADRVQAASAGVSGGVSANFASRLDWLDLSQPGEVAGAGPSFAEDPSVHIPYTAVPPCQSGSGNSPCLGFLAQISGVTDTDTGSYQLWFDPLPDRSDNLQLLPP